MRRWFPSLPGVTRKETGEKGGEITREQGVEEPVCQHSSGEPEAGEGILDQLGFIARPCLKEEK